MSSNKPIIKVTSSNIIIETTQENLIKIRNYLFSFCGYNSISFYGDPTWPRMRHNQFPFIREWGIYFGNDTILKEQIIHDLQEAITTIWDEDEKT